MSAHAPGNSGGLEFRGITQIRHRKAAIMRRIRVCAIATAIVITVLALAGLKTASAGL